MNSSELDLQYMRQAIELARNGQGHVEPNPLVGCVIVSEDEVLGTGRHQKFGGPHAEIAAIRSTGDRAAGATMYVTLEPCSHHGKTPPCCDAIIESKIGRVVIAQKDPFPQVSGSGIQKLSAAGLQVEVGLLQDEAQNLNAPYRKLLASGRPWIIAKWAMTLDGKLASHAKDSRWISNEKSRAIVHRLRSRVDAIMVGSRTALTDDPLLTARPPGARVPVRIVVDSLATLPSDSQLVQTIHQAPVLIAVGPESSATDRRRLESTGCEVYHCPGASHGERLLQLLDELGRRRMTNVLVEGGGRLLGNLFDANAIDEVHAFLAPKIIGGRDAISPLAGLGLACMADAVSLDHVEIETLDNDIYLHGRLKGFR